MSISISKSHMVASLALSLVVGGNALALTPAAKDILSLQPLQKDVDIEHPTPTEVEKCSIKNEGKDSWVVRNASGRVLRIFSDTNGDHVVDQWCYFKDGIEVYRDIDSNFNRKADQCQWRSEEGLGWGFDRNEDGKIDFWKSIFPDDTME